MILKQTNFTNIFVAIAIILPACKKDVHQTSNTEIINSLKMKDSWSLSETHFSTYDINNNLSSTANVKAIIEHGSDFKLYNDTLYVQGKKVKYETLVNKGDTIMRYNLFDTMHEFKLSVINENLVTLEKTEVKANEKSIITLLLNKNK